MSSVAQGKLPKRRSQLSHDPRDLLYSIMIVPLARGGPTVFEFKRKPAEAGQFNLGGSALTLIVAPVGTVCPVGKDTDLRLPLNMLTNFASGF
ncbi:hypothetical protein J2Y48_004509 [Mycoplana sp. BE70]|nr:hypothetical protein [Mycoplana sp. BE70]